MIQEKIMKRLYSLLLVLGLFVPGLVFAQSICNEPPNSCMMSGDNSCGGPSQVKIEAQRRILQRHSCSTSGGSQTNCTLNVGEIHRITLTQHWQACKHKKWTVYQKVVFVPTTGSVSWTDPSQAAGDTPDNWLPGPGNPEVINLTGAGCNESMN